MRRRHGHTPKYSLRRIQEIAASGDDRIHITRSAILGARALFINTDEIIDCVRGLSDGDYEQTLESTKFPGTFQDVYKPRFQGFAIYLKLTMIEDREAVVISFKRNTSP